MRYRVIDVNGNRFALSGEDLRRAVNHEQPGEVLFSSFIERVINEPFRRGARVGAFTGVADLGGGVARLTALPAWFAVPEPARP